MPYIANRSEIQIPLMNSALVGSAERISGVIGIGNQDSWDTKQQSVENWCNSKQKVVQEMVCKFMEDRRFLHFNEPKDMWDL